MNSKNEKHLTEITVFKTGNFRSVGDEVLERVEIISTLLKYSQLVSALLDGKRRKMTLEMDSA